MSDPFNILLIATDVHLAETAYVRLVRAGFHVAVSLNDDVATKSELASFPDLVLADLRVPRSDSLPRLRERLKLIGYPADRLVVLAFRQVAAEIHDNEATVLLAESSFRCDQLIEAVKSKADSTDGERADQSRQDHAHALRPLAAVTQIVKLPKPGGRSCPSKSF